MGDVRMDDGRMDDVHRPGSGPWLACGISGSSSSRAALRWALRETAERDVWLVAVRVWPGGSEEDRLACERDLVATVSDAVRETGVHGRTWVQVVQGDPGLVLSALAEQADLLVLGSHHVPTAG